MENRSSALPEATSQPKDDKLTLQQFTLFPKLPIELRLIIWALCRPKCRTVTLRSHSTTSGYTGTKRKETILLRWEEGIKKEGFFLSADQYLPKIFHISNESRNYASKIYRPILGSFLGFPLMFDFENDTLYISTLTAAKVVFATEASNFTLKANKIHRPLCIGTKLQENAYAELKEVVESLVYLHVDCDLFERASLRLGPPIQPGVSSSLSDLRALKTIRCLIKPDYQRNLQSMLERESGMAWNTSIVDYGRLRRGVGAFIFENTGKKLEIS